MGQKKARRITGSLVGLARSRLPIPISVSMYSGRSGSTLDLLSQLPHMDALAFESLAFGNLGTEALSNERVRMPRSGIQREQPALCFEICRGSILRGGRSDWRGNGSNIRRLASYGPNSSSLRWSPWSWSVRRTCELDSIRQDIEVIGRKGPLPHPERRLRQVDADVRRKSLTDTAIQQGASGV